MDDLLLFRRLRAERLDAAALAPLLEELAGLRLPERFAFFGLLPRALAHEDGALRAAALRALAGANGYAAFRLVVKALGDATEEVRVAAVEALRASSEGQPARFAHALFHPDPSVRRAAVSRALPTHGAFFALATVADPVCRDAVLPLFRAADLSAPPAALPLVLDLAARGHLARTDARALLRGLGWVDVVRGLANGAQRSEDEQQILLDGAAPTPDDQGRDGLDAVLDLVLHLPEDGEDGPARTQADMNQLASSGGAWLKPTARRIVASLLVTLHARGALPEPALRVVAMLHPPFLRAGWVAREARRAAALSLYHAPATSRLDDDALRALLEADVCRRPSGTLDLAVVGGVLHVASQHPYQRLLAWFGEELVVRSFAEDIAGSVRFLALEDDSKQGKRYILDLLAEATAMRPPLLLALTVLASSSDAIHTIADGVDEDGAAALVAELVVLTQGPDHALKTKRVNLLAARLGPKIAARHAKHFLTAWLSLAAPADVALGMATLGAIAAAMEADAFATTVVSLAPALVPKLVAALPFCASLPFGKEMRLALELVAHADPDVRAWAKSRVPDPEKAAVVPAPAPSAHVPALEASAAHALATCAESDLDRALAPCLKVPMRGLAAALALRPTPSKPSVAACVALLASHDALEEVDAQFARFGSTDAAFLSAVDREMVRVFGREQRLPLVGHAWLHRWEAHAFAFAEVLVVRGAVDALREASRGKVAVLRAQPWDALASVVGIWRWRAPDALRALVTDALGDALVDALPSPVGDAAARVLRTLHASRAFGPLLDRLRGAAVAALPDLSGESRAALSDWIESRGLACRPAPRSVSAEAVEHVEVRTTVDLDRLAALSASADPKLATEAALRLMVLGEQGLDRLATVLLEHPSALIALVETIALWPEAPSLERLRERAREPGDDPEVAFRLALGLAGRGERVFVACALRAASAPSPPWFRREDGDALLALGETERSLALALAASPHPHAYVRAVEHLTVLGARPRSGTGAEEAWVAFEAETAAALRAFLDAGRERLVTLRRRAARWLLQRGDTHGFPIVLEDKADTSAKERLATTLDHVEPALVTAAVRAVLLAGRGLGGEQLALDLLEGAHVDRAAREEALHAILLDASNDAVRQAAAGRLAPSGRRGSKLQAVAETFAWGVRLGRELTGRVFTVQMIGGEALGHTRLHENRIHVSALPLLRREQHGKAIVEGLLLHELGHHVHHRGDEADGAWKKAHEEGIYGLLNLVADEHLERNLRARSAEFGDRLKLLAAYAFQHSGREVAVVDLVAALGARTSEVLTSIRLDVARGDTKVAVESGLVLGQMERSGLSFARFVRALRMGLGNRHGDPRVDAALALFRGGFRTKSMPELLDVARRLRTIFGWETALVGSFGPHEGMAGEAADGIIHGEGITPEEVDSEVERILDPTKRRATSAEAKGRARPWINVNPDERFTPITTVVRMPHDPGKHARYARAVARDAARMRRYLEHLGLAFEPQRMRVQGRRFDPTRTNALVLRGDPRILVARELRVRTDLFIGILVDCSGSMQTRDNIEKAKHFAVLLSEAGRGLAGVDVRIFGFTDRVIYDAGDAHRPGAHGLEANGGNNDAAALAHVVEVARASRRRAKLLVMISDGLPTECSVAALRGVVARATKKLHISCAQVAVAKLAEECFPQHVLLEGDDMALAVRRFGGIVAGLVRRVIRA